MQQVLGGKYELVKEIGVGSFGAVYEAYDRKVGRKVAIKVLFQEFESIGERFTHEIDAIRGLEHQNIVRLYDFGFSEGGPAYLVMEYIDGIALDELLDREGRLEVHRVAKMALQILDALVEAHAYGIIHCDLKPENIIITNKGARQDVVKVLDFGIATMIDSRSRSDSSPFNQPVGTPAFMAPEQIQQGEICPATDVYALGLILYELITGEQAFDHDDPLEILRMQLSKELKIPKALLQTDIGLIIQKAIQKRPVDRYKSAKEVYDQIALALQAGTSDPSWGVMSLDALREAAPEESPRRNSPVFDPFDSSRAQDLFGQLEEVEHAQARRPASSAATERALAARDRFRKLPADPLADSQSSKSKPKRSTPRSGNAPRLELDASTSAHKPMHAPKAIEAQPASFKWLWILLAIVVLAGGGFGVYALFPDAVEKVTKPKEEEAPEKVVEEVDPEEKARLLMIRFSNGLATSTAGMNFEPFVSKKLMTAPGGAVVHIGDWLVCRQTPCHIPLPEHLKESPISVVLEGFESVELKAEDFKDDKLIIELKVIE